jgi:hypothetical protein
VLGKPVGGKSSPPRAGRGYPSWDGHADHPIVALVFTARLEEAGSIKRFGDAYLEYKERTRRFIPYIFWRVKTGQRFTK